MRFFSEGPNIPDLLLDRRDQGRVVFLCGAGVSLSAGMPTFYNLTKYVVDFFDPPEGSAIELEFRPWVEDNESGGGRPKTPLDQVFHLLYQEYGREEVNAVVAKRLKNTDQGETKSQEHSVIARIATDQEGNPQIVTTNFDRLFEQVPKVAAGDIYVPPAFPDIGLNMPLTGITYLHGRLQETTAMQYPYVLSSADFGRAYLSEAWATNFIRSLLKSYTVVLVGYQAEDPPVKYLLQGLNHDGLSDRSNLYAFDKGESEDIEAKWRDRGVTAIAFNDYPSLWESLGAWADRADDPRQWRAGIIDLAMKGPRQLSPHERGQVAHIARTTPGARLFARTDPPPPSEWLCVFDAWCRVAKESSGYGEDAVTFDPFEEYCLDDDAPRPPKADREPNRAYDHMLEWRRGDTNPATSHRLSGQQVVGFESMPPRLFHLTNWITKHLGSPMVAWWVMRQGGLHPRLAKEFQRELSRNAELQPEARRIWNLILEYQSDNRNSPFDHGWFEIKDRIKNEGWTSSVLRGFEAVTAPTLSWKPPLGLGASKPPFKGWEETRSEELANWEVKFPNRYGEELDIPDEVLESVFRIVEGHFRRAVGLLIDLDTTYFPSVTCYPKRDVIGGDSDNRAAFSWFLELFSRLVSKFPDTARAHSVTWPLEERFYFRKLKLFALNQLELFEAKMAVESVLELSQEVFWDTDICRELLFLINDRWEEFPVSKRTALFDRMLRGPDKKEYWSEEEYPKKRNEMGCRYMQWLVLQNKALLWDQKEKLEEMISQLPEWDERWASSLVEEHFSSVRSIGTDETPDKIINLPISEIVQYAKAEHQRDFDSFTEKRPFIGLVKARPIKALATLSHEAKRGEYPQEFWSTLINEWPEETSPVLFRAFLIRLGRLPHEAIRELRHVVGRWVEKKLLLAFKFDEVLAWKTFDLLVSGLISKGGAATGSGIGEMRRGGEIINRSRRTIEHAINGPVGNTVKGLIHTLDSLKLDQGENIPEEFKSRLEYLIAAPGEGGDHTVAILTKQIRWLNYLDPEWVKGRVMPWFNFDHASSEPAWNGYLSGAKIASQEISATLKPLLIDLFPLLYQWSWGQHLATVATQMMVELAVFHSDEVWGLNTKEARYCLRNMNDKNRQDAVFRLSQIGEREKDGWTAHVIPFIDTVWPRERAFRTSNLVSSWVTLLDNTGEYFPEVLSAVHRYLVPVERESHWLYQFSRDAGKRPLTVQHPDTVLELLNAVVPNSSEDTPNELAQILDLIEETDPSLASDRRFVRLITLVELA